MWFRESEEQAGVRAHGVSCVEALGFSANCPGHTTPPAPALPHTKAAPRIRGFLLREGAPLSESARVSLRLLQRQHQSGLFHQAGVQSRKGCGGQGGSSALAQASVPSQEAVPPRGRRSLCTR